MQEIGIKKNDSYFINNNFPFPYFVETKERKERRSIVRLFARDIICNKMIFTYVGGAFDEYY